MCCSAGAPVAEAPAAAAGKLTPGIYTATKPGFMGENTMFVTVDDSSIVDVSVGNSTDVPPYITKLAITDLLAHGDSACPELAVRRWARKV